MPVPLLYLNSILLAPRPRSVFEFQCSYRVGEIIADVLASSETLKSKKIQDAFNKESILTTDPKHYISMEAAGLVVLFMWDRGLFCSMVQLSVPLWTDEPRSILSALVMETFPLFFSQDNIFWQKDQKDESVTFHGTGHMAFLSAVGGCTQLIFEVWRRLRARRM